MAYSALKQIFCIDSSLRATETGTEAQMELTVSQRDKMLQSSSSSSSTTSRIKASSSASSSCHRHRCRHHCHRQEENHNNHKGHHKGHISIIRTTTLLFVRDSINAMTFQSANPKTVVVEGNRVPWSIILSSALASFFFLMSFRVSFIECSRITKVVSDIQRIALLTSVPKNNNCNTNHRQHHQHEHEQQLQAIALPGRRG